MAYLIVVIGKEAKDAAWYYPDTVTERAEKIKDHVAFCELKPFLPLASFDWNR